jgi:hypothetical protein
MKMQKNAGIVCAVVGMILASAASPVLAGSNHDSRVPRTTGGYSPYAVPTRPMDPKNVPDFAQGNPTEQGAAVPGGDTSSTLLRSDLQSATLPVQTRMTLIVEYPIDAKTSKPGDIFEAHVKDDLYIGRQLILPRGSLVRGRAVEITKPRLISRAAKIGLRLEQIVTPVGDVIPLDAALEFQKGLTNKQGKLDPGTNLGTRVESSVRTVTGLSDKQNGATKGALLAANVATLGAPALATALGSGAIALFRSGDNISLQPGQELEILLTNDLGIQLQ